MIVAILSLVIALLFVVIILILYTLLERLWVKKYRYTTFKYLFLIILALICLCIRLFSIVGINDDLSNIESWKNSFVAIYTSLASLSFEGQPELATPVLSILYHATGFAEAVSLTLIVALNVSYSFYSSVRLKFTFKSNKEIYVFSAITEDTINLANDISNKNENSVIIFAIDESVAFDGKDELHRRIRESRYFFINSLDETKSGDVSIIKLLHLAKKSRTGRIHFLAMNTNEKKVGLETENSRIILDEIEAIKKLKNANALFNLARFYVLTNNTIDYEFYDIKLMELGVNNARLKIINEASLVGLDLSNQRSIKEINRIKQTGLINEGNYNLECPNKDYVTYVFGFGQTGQKALDNLFIDVSSLFLDKDNKDQEYRFKYAARGFTAYVFDAYISNISSIYAKQHPSYIFYKDDEVINEERLKEAYGKEIYQETERRLRFPKVYLSNQNVKDISFPKLDFNNIDAVIISLGNDEDNIEVANALLKELRQQILLNKEDPRLSLEIFVNIANSSNNERVTSLDTDLLEKEMAKRFLNISVVTFGNLDKSIDKENASSVYSYESIIDESSSESFERIYSYGDPFKGKAKEYEIVKSISEIAKDEDDPEKQKSLKKKKKAFARNELKEDFKKNKVYERNYNHLSSLYAASFVDYYYAYYLRLYNNDPQEMLNKLFNVKYSEEDPIARYLAQLEHIRWSRFVMAYGCIFIKDYPLESLNENDPQEKYTEVEKQKEYCKIVAKVHNCLLPYGGYDKGLLPEWYEEYDYFNVFLGTLLEYQKAHSKE